MSSQLRVMATRLYFRGRSCLFRLSETASTSSMLATARRFPMMRGRIALIVVTDVRPVRHVKWLQTLTLRAA